MDLRVMHSRDRGVGVLVARLVVGFCAIVLIGVFLGRLVTGPLYPWATRNLDEPLRSFSLSHASANGLRAARDISAFGTATVTGLVALVAGVIWSVRERNARPALLLVVAFAGALAMAVIVKYVVHRAPASGPITALTPGTFPSGHTLFASVVYGAIAVLVWRTHRPRAMKLAVAIPLIALPILIAAARLYLLDHFFTDAFGSIVLGSLWVAVAFVVIGREPINVKSLTSWRRPNATNSASAVSPGAKPPHVP